MVTFRSFIIFHIAVLFKYSFGISDFEYRLPNQPININHYDISIKPYFEGEKKFTFDGRVVIDAIITESNVKTVILHASFLKLSKIELKNAKDEILDVTDRFEHVKNYDFLKIHFDKSLPLNEQVKIYIDYEGMIHDDVYGLYKSYYVENGKIKWLASTQFQPVYARRVFPCLDEPQYKSNYTINVIRPKHFSNSLSNMNIKDTILLDDDNVLETFYTTPLMSTYLIAIVISEYTSTNTSEEYKVWSRPGIEKMRLYPNRISERAIKTMENYVNYPFSNMKMKQHHVAIPDFDAAAMENWGLVVYRESLLMYDENETSDRTKQNIASIILHETSHYWFGDLITCKWWSDVWLNEGFAQFFQFHLPDMFESMEFDRQFNYHNIHHALVSDADINSMPLSNIDTNSPEEIVKMFGVISYKKGASIIRMLKDWIGEVSFKNALNRYVEKMKYRNSVPEDLFDSLQQQVDLDKSIENDSINITQFMKSWTLKSGYPVLNVKIDRKTGIVTIGQERFVKNRAKSTDITGIWDVPISWTTGKNCDFDNVKPKFILTEKQANIDEKVDGDDWIIFNIRQSGFYRVNYDDYTWKIISDVLSSDERTKIHELNRAQIVDDIFNFAKEQKMNITTALNILKFLKSETDFAPWMAAFKGFKNLRFNLLSDSEKLEKLQNYVLEQIDNLIKLLGFEDNYYDSHLTKVFRMDTLNFACLFQHGECKENARKLLKDYVNDRNNKIHKNSKEYVYCFGLEQGDDDDFDDLWNKYLDAVVPSEKSVISSSLGCTNSKDKIQILLHETISENSLMHFQDKIDIFNSIINIGYSHVVIAYEFFKDNLPKIKEVYGFKHFSEIINNMANKMSIKHLQEMRNLIDDSQQLDDVEKNDAETYITEMINERMLISKLFT